MQNPDPLSSIDTEVNFWPGLIDMLTAILMFFLLIHFLQTTLNIENLRIAIIGSNQEEFKKVFEKEFAREKKAGTVWIEADLNFLEIRFSDKILFAKGEYELQETGKQVLRRSLKVLTQTRETDYEQVQIEGHTDHLPITRGGYPSDNWELSTARAISVVKFFLDESPLPKNIFSANGYADTRPIEPIDRDDPEGEPRNRRIEIRVIFSERVLQNESQLR